MSDDSVLSIKSPKGAIGFSSFKKGITVINPKKKK